MKPRSDKANAKYVKLRSRLIEQGLTLRRFAIDRSYPLGTVYDAASGRRAGIVATKIKKELEEIAYGV